MQPHTKPSCCWSQSDVCKWIIQYIEVVNGIIRGEQTFKLSAYQARWEDTSSCVCKCITYTTWIVTSVYPRDSGRALNLLVCIFMNGIRTIKRTCGFCPNILSPSSTLQISSLLARPNNGALPKYNLNQCFKTFKSTLQWSLLEIPEFFCLSTGPHVSVCISQHTHKRCQGSSWVFARSCPEAQRDLLASFACKVECALLWAWGASRQPLPCGLPDWASQKKPSLFPTCWGGAWQHRAQHLKALSISSVPGWGQPSEEQQVGKDKHDPFTKTPLSQTDKGEMGEILKKGSYGAAQYQMQGLKCSRHCISIL